MSRCSGRYWRGCSSSKFPLLASQNGVRLVILNREPTDLDDLAEVVLNLEIGRTLGEAGRAE